MSDRESNFRAWLAKADNDALNIQNNLAARRVPWDTICFHAQQAAEKCLKAFLAYHGHEPPRTHDLVALLTECASIDPALTGLEEDCRRLTYYAVTARYPADLYEPDEVAGRQMVAVYERVRAAVGTRLPP